MIIPHYYLKIEASPVIYIMDAINSGGTSCYRLKTEERFKKRINNINGEILSDDFLCSDCIPLCIINLSMNICLMAKF